MDVTGKSRVPEKELELTRTSGRDNNNYPDGSNDTRGYTFMTGADHAVDELLQDIRSNQHDLKEISIKCTQNQRTIKYSNRLLIDSRLLID